jgi:hypothetical protein
MITRSVGQALASPDSTQLTRAIELLRLTQELGIRPDLERAQELAYRANDVMHAPEQLSELARLLWLDPALLTQPQA